MDWAIRSQATVKPLCFYQIPMRLCGRFNDCKAYRASGIYSLAPWETRPFVLLSILWLTWLWKKDVLLG